MNQDQESAIAALLAYLSQRCGSTFLTYGRRLKFWDDVSEQPALFLQHTEAEDSWTGTIAQRTTVKVMAWVYAKTGPDDVPDTVLNALVLSLRNALAGDAFGNPVSLRNPSGTPVARYARIEGKSEFFPGDTADQAIAVVPITLLLP